jgi:hypothetical protein
MGQMHEVLGAVMVRRVGAMGSRPEAARNIMAVIKWVSVWLQIEIEASELVEAIESDNKPFCLTCMFCDREKRWNSGLVACSKDLDIREVTVQRRCDERIAANLYEFDGWTCGKVMEWIDEDPCYFAKRMDQFSRWLDQHRGEDVDDLLTDGERQKGARA